jgi:thioredoxin reductase (NADPH)
MNYDVVIVGGGPAGLSAGIYSARYKMKTLMICQLPGGLATKAHIVENYPGFESIDGTELSKRFKNQAESCGMESIQGEVVSIERKGKGFAVKTADNKVHNSRSIILCLGSVRRKLNVPGEDEYLGRGVSYCATCDAAFFKDKKVVVIGGSDTALKGTLVLEKHARKVIIIYRKERLRGEPLMREKVLSSKKISVLYNSVPVKIEGNNKLGSILVKNTKTGRLRKVETEGVFVEIGDIPSIALAKQMGVKTNKEGYVKVSREMETSVAGVFAAGDVTDSTRFKQIVTSASQGSIAAYSCYLFLNKEKSKGMCNY